MFSITPTIPRRKPSKKWFLLGAVGSALLVLYDTFFRSFYIANGLSSDTLALIMVAFAIWNAFNDPIFGFISDRIKSPLGRRKPMILIGAIPFGLAFYFMFNPLVSFIGKPEWVIALYAFIILFFYDAFYSMVYGAWMSCIPEMYREQDELRKFNVLRNVIMIVAVVAMTLLTSMLGVDESKVESYRFIGILAGVLMPIVLLLSTLGIRENPVYQKNFNTPVGKSIKQAFQNKPFVSFVGYHAFYNIGKMLVNTNIAMLVVYGIVKDTFMGLGAAFLMVGLIAVVSAVMYPVWNVLIPKVTKDWTNVVTLVICMVGCAVLQFANSITYIVIAGVIFGIGQSGYGLGHDLYNARNYDYHFAIIDKGQRAEGSYSGVGAFIDRLVSMGGPLAISLIYFIFGYKETYASDGTLITDIGINGLAAVRTVSGLGAMLFFLIAALLAAFLYDLRGKKWLDVKDAARKVDAELIAKMNEEQANEVV